jgi:hypothetical protein
VPAPNAPVILSPEAGVTVSREDLVLAGTGVPGATVTVTGRAGIVTVVAAADGSWSADPLTLTGLEGKQTFIATQTLDDQASFAAEVTFILATSGRRL